ncbi:MAG: glutamate 5-kinase [Anaerolineaceae bacterium]|nr:glutamate 5-kinase [Anaerolineaceae bacterium]
MTENKENNSLKKRIIIKLGTSTLTDGTPFLSQSRMIDLVRQMSKLKELGADILLVSSGAIESGREVLNFPHLPKDIPAKQMLAAVGQPRLMDVWGKLFGIFGLGVAQILLTRDDLRSRSRYLNARNTIQSLLAQGVIPVINENDTVATEEIRVGDNDNLSALIANLLDADLLILLTDQDGLFNADPRKESNASLVNLVDTPEIAVELWAAAGGSGKLGRGGMFTKLQSADLARRSGTEVVIARGDDPDIILRIAEGQALGTRFTATTSAIESRKRYILAGDAAGVIELDSGALEALRNGSSLLPAGLKSVAGEFVRGETIGISDLDGHEIGRGLVSYNSSDCLKLVGKHSWEIPEILGYYFGDEIMHRNNLVLF